MLKGFNLRCAAGKTARVWEQGKGGMLSPGVALVLLPVQEGETEDSQAGYVTDLRTALIDDNHGFINVVVCGAASLAVVPAGESPASRGVQPLL
jgi:hypothetical protein